MNPPVSLSFRAARVSALAIAGMPLLVMLALSHHPVVGHHADVHEAQAQIAQLASADNLVHGALTAILVILASALAAFGNALGPRRAAVSGALAAYSLGCALLGVAMLFDGFVVPQLARQLASAPSSEAEAGMLIMRAIGATIQVFSKAGLLAHCVAILGWSYAAATSRLALPGLRWCAAVGAAAALLPAALILFTDMQLTPHSLMAIFSAHAAWYFMAAWLLYRYSLARSRSSLDRLE